MNQITEKNISKFILSLLFLLILLQIFSRVINSSLDYDEGFNLQISLNLRKSLSYTTFDGMFDHRITTGPTVLIPAAIFVNSFFPLLPRVIPAMFSLILIIFVLNKILENKFEKIIFLILICFLPLYFLFSSKVLGEIPGLVFLVFSYWFFNRDKWFLCGLFLGLSVLTKNIYLIGTVPLILFLLLQLLKPKPQIVRIFFRSLIFLAGGFISIYLIWGLYIFLSSSFNFDQFLQVWSNYFSEIQKLSHPAPKLLNRRLEMIGYVFNFHPIVFSFLAVLISLYIFVKKRGICRLLALYFLISFLYFLFRGSTNLYRHIFPAIVCMVIITPLFVSDYFKRIKKMRTMSKLIYNSSKERISSFAYITLPVLLLFLFINPYEKAWGRIEQVKLYDQSLLFLEDSNHPFFSPTPLLIGQLQIAKFINQKISVQDKIAGFEWWNAPEIIYLANRNIGRNISDPNVKYIIYQIYGQLSPGLYKSLDKEILKSEIYQSYGYTIFKRD